MGCSHTFTKKKSYSTIEPLSMELYNQRPQWPAHIPTRFDLLEVAKTVCMHRAGYHVRPCHLRALFLAEPCSLTGSFYSDCRSARLGQASPTRPGLATRCPAPPQVSAFAGLPRNFMRKLSLGLAFLGRQSILPQGGQVGTESGVSLSEPNLWTSTSRRTKRKKAR